LARTVRGSPARSRNQRPRSAFDQIRTIDTSDVTGELVDYLSRDDMAHVEHSLSRYLGLLR